MLNPFSQNLYYVQYPSHYIPISLKHMQLCVNIFLSSHAFYCTYNLLSVWLLQTANSSTTSSCPAQSSRTALPCRWRQQSLRNYSKYSSADAAILCRKLECWQHRCKNVKSRIPYTWLFCWDIKNPNCRFSRPFRYKLLSTNKGHRVLRYSISEPTFLRYVPAVSVIWSQLSMLSVSRNVHVEW